jgi:hypothetical protein
VSDFYYIKLSHIQESMVQAGSKEEQFKGWKGWAKHIFGSKELFLLLLGALITGLLIPVFLEQSQNFQKELEVKTNLVKQITETTSRPITLVNALEQSRRGDNSTEFANDTKRTLTIERLDVLRAGSVLKSQLQTYFPDTDIPAKWQNLTTATHNFVRLFYYDDFGIRKNLTAGIYELLGNDPEKAEVAINQTSNRTSEAYVEYGDGYGKLQDLLIAGQDNVIDNITKHKIPAYQNIFSIFGG